MKTLRSLKVTASAVLMISILIAAEASQAIGEGFLIAGENQMTKEVNSHRSGHGAPVLGHDPALQMLARRQAQRMASAGYIYHNPDFDREAAGAVPNWLRIGENVGVGSSVSSVQAAFLASPSHHANIDRSYNVVGVGAVPNNNGRLFFTQNFAQSGGSPVDVPSSLPPPPPPPPEPVPSQRDRHAGARGTELVHPGGGTEDGARSGASLPGVLIAMLGRAADKVTFWN